MMILLMTPTFFIESSPECLLFATMLITPLMWQSFTHLPVVSSMTFFYDNLSLSLIFLSFWLGWMTLYYANLMKKSYIMKILILLLLISLISFFLSSSMVMFYIFFELSVIPTFMIIIGWGYQPERLEASYFFFFYTVFASLPFLAMLVWTDFPSMLTMGFLKFNSWIGIGMIFALLVKLPLYLFHVWLPKAHVEAPLVGSMLLAGILLKMGGYGILRLGSLFSLSLSFVISSIGLIGMIYACVACIIHTDMKTIVAYSSVSHMNFLVIGLLSMKIMSVSGSMLMMVSHGLISSFLFLFVNELFNQTGSRSMMLNKFFNFSIPSMLLLLFLFVLLNLAVPPSIGMASELYISIVKVSMLNFSGFFLMVYFFLSAFYSIMFYSSLTHGMEWVVKIYFPITIKVYMLFLGHLVPMLLILFNMEILS